MRCPKCRCEVGSQKMCPYCGAQMETPEQRLFARGADSVNRLYRYVRSLDGTVKDQGRKLDILLVLGCGNLLMTLLILIALLFM